MRDSKAARDRKNRERETERQTDTDRQTERQRNTDRQIDKQADRQTGRQADRQTNRQIQLRIFFSRNKILFYGTPVYILTVFNGKIVDETSFVSTSQKTSFRCRKNVDLGCRRFSFRKS